MFYHTERVSLGQEVRNMWHLMHLIVVGPCHTGCPLLLLSSRKTLFVMGRVAMPKSPPAYLWNLNYLEEGLGGFLCPLSRGGTYRIDSREWKGLELFCVLKRGQ